MFLLDFFPRPLFDANLVPGTDLEFLIGWARRIAGGDLLGRGSGPFWWAPLFPYILAGVFALFGPGNLVAAALAQALLAALTVSLLYLLGRWLLDEASGLLAGLLAAAYGPAIFYTGIFLSTTLEVFLAVSTLLALTLARQTPTPARWFGAGVITGLACLARPNLLLGAVLLWLLLPWLLPQMDGRPDWRRVRSTAIAFALGVLLAIAPATLRNWAIGGRMVLISAAGPETFRIANSYDSTPVNFVYPKSPPMPLTSAAFWRHQARKAILFWWGFEAPQNVNYYLARETSPVLRVPWVSFWLAVPLAAVGLWATRSQARSLAHVYVFLGAYYVSVVAFFIIARWRLPLIIPLLLFTAAGVLALVRWAAAKRWRSTAAGMAVVAGLGFAIHPGPGPFIFPADHGELGYILANRGDYAGAVDHLAQAASGLPQQGPLHRDLGILLYRLGRQAEARAPLERAITLMPDDAVAHRYLGRVLLAPGGDAKRARLHLSRALALAPQGPGAGEIRALLETLTQGRRLP